MLCINTKFYFTLVSINKERTNQNQTNESNKPATMERSSPLSNSDISLIKTKGTKQNKHGILLFCI